MDKGTRLSARHRMSHCVWLRPRLLNEVLVSGKVQVASAGNFPYTSLLDKQIPVKVIALIT